MNYNNNINYHYHSHFKLPITTNPFEYGVLIKNIHNIYILAFNKNNFCIITLEKDSRNYVEFFRNNTKIFTWIDDGPSINFTRTILNSNGDKSIYHFLNFTLIKKRKLKFFIFKNKRDSKVFSIFAEK